MSDERLPQLEERITALESIIRQRPVEPDCLYTPAEVATWLRCGKTNVYDLMTGGEIASTRIGCGKKGLRIKGSSITAFLDERTEGGPSPKSSFKYLKGYLAN
jgi:excisionase family DNA binding protein